jgi:hypothetical protein
VTRTSDPLERLRGANPFPTSSVERVRADPLLFRAIVSGQVRSRPVPARRRRRIVVPALAAAGLLGGTVAYAVLREPAAKPQNAGCYESADLEATTLVVSVGAEGPAAACAEVWRRGLLGPGGEVPPLTECLLTTGVVGVFPARTSGQDVCNSLARSSTTVPAGPASSTVPPSADVNERFRLLRESVLPQFLGAACLDPGSATDIVRGELDRAGLRDWRVTTAGEFSADRPCATLGFRPEAGEVLLVPSTPRR